MSVPCPSAICVSGAGEGYITVTVCHLSFSSHSRVQRPELDRLCCRSTADTR